MKITQSTLIILIITVILFSTSCQENQQKFPSFYKFIQSYQKKYTDLELVYRKQIYDSNIKRYISENCSHCGVSNLTDWSPEELLSTYFQIYFLDLRTLKTSEKRSNWATQSKKPLLRGRQLSELPEQWDWRIKSQMTPVKNIGRCGASWAFSAVAFFQQDSIINLGQTAALDLSEQFLIGCDLQSQQCKGGFLSSAMNLVVENQGLPEQTKYPYQPITTSIDYDVDMRMCRQTDLFKISSALRMTYYKIEDENTIKRILLKKPVNIAVCAKDFSDYHVEEGAEPKILKCSPNNRILDQSVLLVGYTKEYWIVKNQWGEDWGIGGYAYISKDPAHDCCIGEEMHTTGLETPAQECSVSGCVQCVEENTCFKCQKGKWVSHDTQTHTQTCQPCDIQNCQKCFDYYGYCQKCLYGYTFLEDTKMCVYRPLQPHCSYISFWYCQECHKGYELVYDAYLNLICVPKCEDKNCQNCREDYGICSECLSAFKLSYNQTLMKDVCSPYECSLTDCALCDINGKCLKCKNRMVINPQTEVCWNNCTIEGCLSCEQGAYSCEACQTGKSYDYSTYKCQTFPMEYCATIYFSVCQFCIQGYEFEDQNNEKCIMICETGVDNCQLCLEDDLTVCTKCKPGYELSQVSPGKLQCERLACDIENCLICSDEGTCSLCLTRFHSYNSDKNICQINCQLNNCQLCLPGDQICSKCKPGTAKQYYTQQCLETQVDHCTSGALWDKKFECWDCEENYQLSTIVNTCKFVCQDQKCQVCDQKTQQICFKCLDGYGLQLQRSFGLRSCSCIETLIPNCKVGNQQHTYCFQCKDFYYWNNDTKQCEGNSEGCIENCKYCPRDNSELDMFAVLPCQCQEGYIYYQFQYKCIQRGEHQNCQVLQKSSDGPYCVICSPGYQMDLANVCVIDCIVNNCLDCFEYYPQKCKTCMSGFFDDDYGNCVACPEGCELCSDQECFQCKLGYLYNIFNENCERMELCQDGKVFNGYKCICPQGQYLRTISASQSKCAVCQQPHCFQCTQTSCQECNQGYFLANIQESITQCQPCMANCMQCQSTDLDCSKCSDGFFFDLFDKQCIRTGSNGETWSYTGDLSSAYEVIVCPARCLTCDEMGKCIKCKDHAYFLQKDQSNTQCFQCQGNCKTCLQAAGFACLSCFDGYFFSKYNSSCVACKQQTCFQCSVSTQICSRCVTGYYVDSKAECKACDDGCHSCTESGCLECFEGLSLTNINGKDICQPCNVNCAKCNGALIHQCLKCKTGLFMNIESKCQPCPQNCSSCTSQVNCLDCKDKYVLRQGGCYLPCSEGCQACGIEEVDVCSKCFLGYNLSSEGVCQPDPNSCSLTNSCKGCPKGYVLQTSNSTCIACETSLISNCSQCRPSNPKLCAQCIKGYFLEEKLCHKCQYKCKSCIQLNKCLQCQDGYYLQRDALGQRTSGKCHHCSSKLGCLTCFNDEVCLSCREGFLLGNYGRCIPKQQISLVIILDMNIEDYTGKAILLREALLSIISQGYSIMSHYINVYSIVSGSTKLNLTIAIPQTENSQTTYKKFKNTLAEKQTLANIGIISVNSIKLIGIPAKSNNGQLIAKDTKAQLQLSSTSLIIILAIVIPVISIALIIVGCVYYKYKNQTSISNINTSSTIGENNKISHPLKKKSKAEIAVVSYYDQENYNESNSSIKDEKQKKDAAGKNVIYLQSAKKTSSKNIDQPNNQINGQSLSSNKVADEVTNAANYSSDKNKPTIPSGSKRPFSRGNKKQGTFNHPQQVQQKNARRQQNGQKIKSMVIEMGSKDNIYQRRNNQEDDWIKQ